LLTTMPSPTLPCIQVYIYEYITIQVYIYEYITISKYMYE